MTISFENKDFNQFINSSEFLVEYDVMSALEQEGLKQSDYAEICRRLNRAPNRNELGMFGVMWSEHCCYRNSRPLLKNFPTTGSRILVGPGENAGVVDIGFGQRLVFKIESHNHPSAVEPFQGAATGVGGILRDIFTMGARPIALLNAFKSSVSSCLIPTPTPSPKAPPEKLGPTVTTDLPDFSAKSVNEALAARATSHLPEAKSKFTSS